MSAEISMESIFNHLGDLLTLTEREVGIYLNCDIEVEEMAVTTRSNRHDILDFGRSSNETTGLLDNILGEGMFHEFGERWDEESESRDKDESGDDERSDRVENTESGAEEMSARDTDESSDRSEGIAAMMPSVGNKSFRLHPTPHG